MNIFLISNATFYRNEYNNLESNLIKVLNYKKIAYYKSKYNVYLLN